jgi:hypothetical protein
MSKRRVGLALVSKTSSEFFSAEDKVPETGIYRVFHGPHRLTHEVTLLHGEAFPRCAVCKDEVHFKLVQAAPTIDADPSFHIRLYEVPHPTEQDELDDQAEAASA